MEKWDSYTKYREKMGGEYGRQLYHRGEFVGTLDYFFCAVEAEKRDYSAVRKIRRSAKE